MDIYRALWSAAAGLIAVTAPVVAIASAGSAGCPVLIVVGLLAGTVAAYADHEARPALRTWRRRLRILAGVLLLAFVVAGVVVACGASGVLLLAVFLLLAPPAVRRAVLRPSSPEAPVAPADPSVELAFERSGRTLLLVHSLSDDDLRLLWRDSGALVGRGSTVAERLRVVRLRETVLDELERRDPDGFVLTRFRAR